MHMFCFTSSTLYIAVDLSSAVYFEHLESWSSKKNENLSSIWIHSLPPLSKMQSTQMNPTLQYNKLLKVELETVKSLEEP